jgi:hypothetical protein
LQVLRLLMAVAAKLFFIQICLNQNLYTEAFRSIFYLKLESLVAFAKSDLVMGDVGGEGIIQSILSTFLTLIMPKGYYRR